MAYLVRLPGPDPEPVELEVVPPLVPCLPAPVLPPAPLPGLVPAPPPPGRAPGLLLLDISIPPGRHCAATPYTLQE